MAIYRKHTKLGSGGFAEVWESIREGDGKHFAKKILVDETDEAIARFQREVRILSKLDHPRIVKVLGVKLRKAPYWYIMPLYKYSLRDELPEIVDEPVRVNAIFSLNSESK